MHSMFPHIPLQAITLDLADTHSVSLTVDRVLNNTIYIPEQHQLQQQQQNPQQLEPLPLIGSQHTSSLHHGSSTEGDSTCSSSDQEVTGGLSSTESNITPCTSSRDSSETPPPEQGSTLSNSRGTESDNAHSDSSALELEEATSETILRRRNHHHHHRKIDASTDSSMCSSTGVAGASDTASVSSSSDGRTEAVVEDRIGLALSTPNGQMESFGAQLRSGRVDLGYTGPGLASLEHRRRGGLGSVGSGGGLGTFSSLQQRKEEMLKKARE